MSDSDNKNPNRIHEASASVYETSSIDSSPEVINFTREDRINTDSMFTDTLTSHESRERITELQQKYKALIKEKNWEKDKANIALSLDLSLETIINFATLDISFRGGSVTLRKNRSDKGNIIYAKTLDKLFSYFNRLGLTLIDKDMANSLANILIQSEKIYFEKGFVSKDANKVKEGLLSKELDLRKLRLHLAEIKDSTDHLTFLAEAQEKCKDLIKRFKEEKYHLYGGIIPEFFLRKNFKAGVLLLSCIPLETVRDLNRKSRSNSKINNLKLYLTGQWEKVNFEDLSETKEIVTPGNSYSQKAVKNESSKTRESDLSDFPTDTISAKQAAVHLRSSGIIAMATEGLYGLSCDPDSEQAVKNLLLLKERSKNKGLIITSGDISHLFKYFNGENFKYFDEAQKVWSEEPTSVLIPKNEACSTWLSGEFETIALRLSDHPQIKEITKEFGGPIVTTSANLSGAKDIESLDELDKAFGKNALIVRGELGSLGGATRIVDLVNEKETIRYAKLAVVGKPISHSKSPEIHNDFAQQHSLKINFAKEEVAPESFKGWLEDFFGPQSWGRGVSVTLPLKETAVDLADQVTDEARLAGSSNVLYRKNGKILANNTDGVGFVRDIEKNLDFPLEGKKVLLLGAGGAARGIIPAILEKKPSLLKIANRTEEKANSLRIYFESNIQGIRDRKIISSGNLSDEFLLSSTYDLVINATSISTLSEESLGLPKALFSGTKLAYDLFYSAKKTAFMQEALAAGAEKVSDGWGMLVEQGAESFRLWTNLIPDTSRLLEKPID